SGTLSATHPHVWIAVLLGGLITTLPVALALLHPGMTSTRYVIAVAQMLWSSLLIHLTGGRIETHFHVFGSLAFLAFYRDWRVLVPATVVVAADHFLRGVYWPQSVFGILTSSPWRWVEHAAWVTFEDIFLVYACVQSVDEMHEIARQRAQLEAVNEQIERTVLTRTAELRASQERFIQAFTSAPIGMALVSPQGQWLQVNRALCEMVGYAEDELTATTFDVVTHPDDHAADRAALQQLLAGEVDVVRREKRYLHKARQTVWVSLNVSAVRDAAGTPLYQIAQIQDITASKQARVELEQAKEAAEAASSAKSEFLATMSHELRTPLNIILGYISLMRELEFGPLTAEQSGALERVQKGAVELLHLIVATLDLGRLEAGRVPVVGEWVEPETLLREIDAETRELQEKPGIRVVWEIPPDLPSVHTDPAKLKIVIKNLLGNAIKFTDHGQIIIRGEECGRELLVTVCDTGIGISPEVLPIIFEPFRQGDGSPT
ncbi:MAG: PAS domain S-box protein, partial [Thermoanaerobaculia bacterium]